MCTVGGWSRWILREDPCDRLAKGNAIMEVWMCRRIDGWRVGCQCAVDMPRSYVVMATTTMW